MATYEKFNAFVEAICHKKHDLETDTLEVALTATASAPVAGNSILTDLTQITYTDLSARTITTSTSSQTTGTYDLVLNDLTINCTGAGANAFQYVAVFNQTATDDDLICFFDYGSALTLANGESITIDFESDGGSTGSLFTLT